MSGQVAEGKMLKVCADTSTKFLRHKKIFDFEIVHFEKYTPNQTIGYSSGYVRLF